MSHKQSGTVDMETMGRAITDKRKSLGLSRKEMSDALRLSDASELKAWEEGDAMPTLEQYHDIMRFADHVPFPAPVDPRFRFVDLFSGIGGLRIPFQEQGGECVFSSEWNKFSQKTYAINFGEIPNGDITKISSEDVPDFDVLLAGFPCQPFSQAGLHKGFTDTRGTMFFEVERIIRGKRPKAFLLENVKQLRGHDKGRTFKVIMDHLDEAGYQVTARVLRARDFGVPQNRERIYIVGFDREYYDIPDDYEFIFPEPTMTPTRLGDILEEDPDPKYTISDRLWEWLRDRREASRRKGNGFGYSLFTGDSPYANTITARYYKDGNEILIEQEGRNPRKLTPREAARLQGFPDDFIIPVSDTQAYRQFGNSVAVPVVRCIAKRMTEEMDALPVRSGK